MLPRPRFAPPVLPALLAALALSALAPSAQGKAPAKTIDLNSGAASSSKLNLYQFVKGWSSNPFNAEYDYFSHAFRFDNVVGSGAGVTSLRFASDELGVNRTFTGADTAATTKALRDYLHSKSFSQAFHRLLARGAGGHILGSPHSSVGMAVRQQFVKHAFTQNVTTYQQKTAPPNPNPPTDPSLFGGFGLINEDSVNGTAITAAPGFTLDFGEQKDRHLNIQIPVGYINLGGIKTYQLGTVLQYKFPYKLGPKDTLSIGPGISYVTSKTQDVPDYSGIGGLAMALSLNHDFTDRTFGTVGGYASRFQDLAPINTGTRANIFGWGLQGGRRIGERWVVTMYVVGMLEYSKGHSANRYETIGAAADYKIFNSMDLQFSFNGLTGLPGQSALNAGLGSAWFF